MPDGLWDGSPTRLLRAVLRRRPPLPAAALLLLAAIAAVVFLPGGDDDARPARARTSLLDALAPILSTGAPSGAKAGAAAKLGVPLDRAAAQLFLVGMAGTGPQAPFLRRLRVRDWGGIVLTRDNWAGSRRRFAALTAALRATARRAGHTPPLVVTVAPGGEDNALPFGPPPPAAITGAAEAEDAARAAAGILRALGVQAVLGPPAQLAIAGGAWEGRGFDGEPSIVAQRAGATVRGWQAGGVLAIPGRFPGEGAASQDPADGPASVGLSLEELRAADLVPFRALGPRVVATQLSGSLYAAFDGVTPATLLPEAVKLLRETDPDGIAVSADLQAVTLSTGGTVAEAAVAALRAGCDLLYVPGDAADQEAAFRAVVRAMRSGAIPGERLADALRRAAAVKRSARVPLS